MNIISPLLLLHGIGNGLGKPSLPAELYIWNWSQRPVTLLRASVQYTTGEVGCRHPELAQPAMEAAGIDVFAPARAAGLSIEVVRSEEDSADYFTLVLVE